MENIIKIGDTEVETLRLNNWGLGDILEGDEGTGPSRILITGIGLEKFLCKWDHKNTGTFRQESSNTTLNCRNWKKVGSVYDN